MKEKLVEYTLDTIRDRKIGHHLPLLTDNGQELLGIRLSAEIIRGSDKRILNIPRRKAVTEKLQQQGEGGDWLHVRGVMEGNIAGGEIPLGSLPASLGFSAKGLLEYRYLVPIRQDSGDIAELTQILEKLNFKLPFSSFCVQHMEIGTEFEIIGKGNGKLTATAGWNYQTGILTAQAGVNVEAETDRVFALSIIRLENDKLSVKVDKGVKRRSSAGLGLSVSTDINHIRTVASSVLDNLDDSVVDFNDFTKDVLGPENFLGVGALVEEKGLEPILEMVQAYHKFHVMAGSSNVELRQSVTAFTFSLNKKSAREAYLRLLRLDDGQAIEYAMDDPEKHGVSVAISSVHQTVEEVSLSASLGEKQILLLQAIQMEQERRHLENRVMHIERKSRLQDSKSSIFRGNEEIRWEDAELTCIYFTHSPPEQSQYLFGHMAYSNKDKVTRANEIRDFLLFTEFLGCYRGKSLPSPTLWKHLLDLDNNSERKVDIYFSNEAFARLATVKKGVFWKAFVDVRSHFVPLKKGQSPLPLDQEKVRKKYFEGERWDDLRLGQEDSTPRELTPKQVEEYPYEYKNKYGRKIDDDIKEYLLGR